MITYDVADDKRRLRVSSELENFGRRVQFSVFECHLSEEQVQELQRRLAGLIQPEEDRIRYCRLCRKDLGQVRVDGPGEVTEDQDYYLL